MATNLYILLGTSLYRTEYQSRANIILPDRLMAKPQCMNEDVKAKGFFWIYRRVHIPNDCWQSTKSCYQLIAVIDDPTNLPNQNILGSIDIKRGNCHRLVIREGNDNCGIFEGLSNVCMQYEEVKKNGGINPLTES